MRLPASEACTDHHTQKDRSGQYNFNATARIRCDTDLHRLSAARHVELNPLTALPGSADQDVLEAAHRYGNYYELTMITEWT